MHRGSIQTLLLLEVRRRLNSDPWTLAALAQVSPSPSEAVGLLSVARLETICGLARRTTPATASPGKSGYVRASNLVSRSSGPGVADEFLIIADHLLGEHFGEMLRSGIDPFASAGRFDLEADMLDQMP